MEKEPQRSVPLLLGAEDRDSGGVGVSTADRPPFPGGNEPGSGAKGALSSWLHLLGGGLPSHRAVLMKSCWIFLNKCFSTCYMPLGKFP